MRNRHWIVIAGLLAIVALLAACNSAPNVEWTVEVSGKVETPLALDYNTLVAMPQTDLKDVLMDKAVGEDEATTWSGVAIADIFKKAGVTAYSSVTATAADGYIIEISKDEMQGALIALKKGDEWISKAEPDKGPLRLICPQTPANRWVYQIQSIQVNP
ncbi:MAG: molybdopterin-dependent oxidoreductase [Anaerolineae bacterium]|nr:molybdopterin-dependent oxidoreductase [Anaerolineae bacterium]